MESVVTDDAEAPTVNDSAYAVVAMLYLLTQTRGQMEINPTPELLLITIDAGEGRVQGVESQF